MKPPLAAVRVMLLAYLLRSVGPGSCLRPTGAGRIESLQLHPRVRDTVRCALVVSAAFRERWQITCSRTSVQDVLPNAALDAKLGKKTCPGEIPRQKSGRSVFACSKPCEFKWHPSPSHFWNSDQGWIVGKLPKPEF